MNAGTDIAELRRPGTDLYGSFGPDWLRDELPGVLAGDAFLARFLRIFQDVADTVRWPAGHLEHYVDITIVPEEVIGWLGKWLDLKVDPAWTEQRQRDFVRRIGPLLVARGTATALAHHLEAIIGGVVQIEESGGVRVHTAPGQADEQADSAYRPEVTVTVTTTGEYSIQRLRELIGQFVPVGTDVEVVVKPEPPLVRGARSRSVM